MAIGIGRIGIIGGAGWLGTAIARALVGSGLVSADRLTCSFRSGKPKNALGCAWTPDNRQLVERSDVVILSVRPEDWPAIDVDAAGRLVISVMAGVTVADIRARMGAGRLARALPNAAAEIGQSYTPYFLSSPDLGDGQIVAALFGSCGKVDAVASEDQIDYFTAMTGSGAAFPALLAEAMMRDAIGRGVAPEIALRAAQQLVIGAGRLQEQGGASPAQVVQAFVDYKGATAAGIIAMRENGFDRAVAAGLEAAFQKARAVLSRLRARTGQAQARPIRQSLPPRTAPCRIRSAKPCSTRAPMPRWASTATRTGAGRGAEDSTQHARPRAQAERRLPPIADRSLRHPPETRECHVAEQLRPFRRAAGPAAPLVFAFHGTGGDEHQFPGLVHRILPGAGIVAPRGDVSEHGANRFFRRRAEGVYDMEDLVLRTGKMAGFIRPHRAAHPGAPAYALGYSSGANILASVLFGAPELFDRVALMHPLIPWTPTLQPGLAGRQVLVTAGRQDPICPLPLTEALVGYLKDQGTRVETALHDGGHGVRQHELDALAAFLGAPGAQAR